jgi:cytochrome c oxidase subunit I
MSSTPHSLLAPAPRSKSLEALVYGVDPALDQAREVSVGADLPLSRGWFGLAVGSLFVAGLLALLLVVARLPFLSGWIEDPLFMRRCLVVHVNLALLVWFGAFAAALFSLLPGRDRSLLPRIALGLAGCGTVAVVVGGFMPHAQPILSNYIPFVDHPTFVGGIVLFLGGLGLYYLSGRLLSPEQPGFAADQLGLGADAAAGLKTSALAFLAALATFAASWAATSKELGPEAYYELVAWGGGHTLQVANVAAMIAVWLMLARGLLGKAAMSGRTAWILFGLLLAPHLASPLLTAEGTLSPLYHLGHTRLMQFGIFPITLVALGICLTRISQAFRDGRLNRSAWSDPALLGLGLSAALTLAGFGLGASIRSSNTMVPAHYHASIGAVTLAFMAVTYRLLPALRLTDFRSKVSRFAPLQLALFGIGQLTFSAGFAIAGICGADRKAYGAEQALRSTGEIVGLGVMGIGGLIAVAGGLLFLALAGPGAAAGLRRLIFPSST